jgi:two-component system, OmpR family, alkaline phosphatase synthesis response regulator PhoP
MMTDRRKTILVVDDAKSFREVLAFSLRSRGWGVIEAENGDDALALATTQEPDLILTDVVIPGRNGFELCAVLKGDERFRHIPIVILSAVASGTGRGDDHWKALSSADAFISKPFQAHHLFRRIEELLSRGARARNGTIVGE